ncbi:MAG: ester cyclase [Rhizobiales bacterium]|nr:ester cyclase [Hyphomicrobiales bacterium]
MMQQMTSAFTGAHQLDLLIDDGSHVAVRGHWNGTHTGDFDGMRATGRPVSFTWIDIFEIRNGKVVREAFETNPMAIMAQIDAMAA